MYRKPHVTSAEVRTQRTIEKSIDTLANERYQLSRFDVTVDEETAAEIGEAIARRDSAAIIKPFGEILDSIEEEFDNSDLSDARDTIETTLQAILPSHPDTILAAITDSSSRQGLDYAITTTNTNLGLSSTEYLRLLETILIAETPQSVDMSEQFRNNPKRYRGTPFGLYARAYTALDMLATSDVGVRSIREGVIEDNPDALAEYLKRETETRIARNILDAHITSIADGNAFQKAGEMRYLLDEDESLGEIEKFQILDWTMLPDDEESRSKSRKIIRDTVASISKHEDMEGWDESRVDLIFEIADIGRERNRQPELYISNTFKSGAGVYVAVSLTHPQDESKRIVVSDNPLYRNAIYFVDELATERDENGTQYGWRDVMVSKKYVARERGATRKYHVGNWQNFAYNICNYEGKTKYPTQDEHIDTPIKPHEYEFEPTIDPVKPVEKAHAQDDEYEVTAYDARTNEAINRLRRARKMAVDVMRDVVKKP